MKKIFPVSTILLLAFLLGPTSLFSQARDSIMALNRKFNREIGVDFQGFFKGTPSTSLVFKVKKQSHLVSLTFSENYRIQVNVSGSVPFSTTVTQTPNVGTTDIKPNSQFSIQPLFGIEKIYYYGRFNLFGGMDGGPEYHHMYQDYNNNNNLGYYYYYQNDYSNTISGGGFSLIPFVGAKYRLSEHFSLTAESALSIGYSFTKTVTKGGYVTPNTGILTNVTTETKTNSLDLNTRYLRFLTLNYHF
jgi:hypothetical protein